MTYDNLTAAVAVSLYQYNIPPKERADKLWNHFDGACADKGDLIWLVDSKNWATEMAAPTAKVFLEHALARYGEEAAHRVKVNLG